MPTVTPWPGYDRERASVRIVLLDAGERLLLFETRDPTMPEIGVWWELPGGGTEPGESVADTAVRELAEEAGLVLSPTEVSAPRWTRDVTYVRRHIRTLQHEVVVTARVPGDRPEVVGVGRTEHERQEYVGHRWWPVPEVVASADRFFPASLPRLLPSYLAGDTVAETLERWN